MSITLAQLTSGYNLAKINSNFTILKDAHNNVAFWLSGGNNIMQQDIDLNSNDLLNVDNISTKTLILNGQAVVPADLGSFAPNSVGTVQIVDGSVTDAKIQSVSATKIPFQQTGGSSVLRTADDKLREILTAKDFGVKGDGITDDTVAIQAALTAAAGKTIQFHAGSFVISSAVQGQNNSTILGVPRQTQFIRPANSANNDPLLFFNGKHGFVVKDIIFDGNKANNASFAANTVLVQGCSDYLFSDCLIRNSKLIAGGYGYGLVDIAGGNQVARSRGIYLRCTFAGNDGLGLNIDQQWFVTVKECIFQGNGAGGLQISHNVFPPVQDVSDGIIVDGCLAIDNNQGGLAILGGYVGGAPGLPIYGSTAPQSRMVSITNNTCYNNGSYGIVWQGMNGNLANNTCELNGTVNVSAAGILCNAANSTITGNIIRNNRAFGIDAGNSSSCSFTGNSFYGNGVSANQANTNLNLGAASQCIASGNHFDMQSTSTNPQIAIGASGIDSDGGPAPFEQVGNGHTIVGNHIFMNSSSGSIGIQLATGVFGCLVSNNHIMYPNDRTRAIVNSAINNRVYNNTVVTFADASNWIESWPSSTNMVIPDEQENIFITGTTAITSITTTSGNLFNQRVRDVVIQNGGSGYTPGSAIAVTFSGGGGSGASGTAQVSNSGKVISVLMLTTGSGYTSNPSVVINGSGSGATGQPLVNCPNYDGRILYVHFTSAGCVVNNGTGNIFLNSGYTSTVNGVLVLKGQGNNWYEIGRH